MAAVVARLLLAFALLGSLPSCQPKAYKFTRRPQLQQPCKTCRDFSDNLLKPKK